MATPRVLVVLDTAAAWSRALLRAFASVAHERGWTVLHYHADVDLEWLAAEWAADATVLGPGIRGPWPALLRSPARVSLNLDRTHEGIASVLPDEEQIARAALAHLRERGLRHLTTFRFDDSPFAIARDAAFRRGAAEAGASLAPAWWDDAAHPPRNEEHPRALVAWLRELPKPCGVFAACDAWSRVVARYAVAAGLRVPEDLALIGVDDDPFECELTAPPLSSVAVPWVGLGRAAAELVHRALRGESIDGQLVVLPPVRVVTRRSSDVLAVEDALVARAVAWIRENSGRRLTVPMVAGAVGSTRQRLERRFRAVLGRTVMQEVRRTHVEAAKQLLATTDLEISRIAQQSGFTTAALLSVAFRNEVGVTPGAYRRSVHGNVVDD